MWNGRPQLKTGVNRYDGCFVIDGFRHFLNLRIVHVFANVRTNQNQALGIAISVFSGDPM